MWVLFWHWWPQIKNDRRCIPCNARITRRKILWSTLVHVDFFWSVRYLHGPCVSEAMICAKSKTVDILPWTMRRKEVKSSASTTSRNLSPRFFALHSLFSVAAWTSSCLPQSTPSIYWSPFFRTEQTPHCKCAAGVTAYCPPYQSEKLVESCTSVVTSAEQAGGLEKVLRFPSQLVEHHRYGLLDYLGLAQHKEKIRRLVKLAAVPLRTHGQRIHILAGLLV